MPDDLLQPEHLLIIFLVAALLLVPAIFFILTLQGALNKCAPSSRAMEPGLLWLYLFPFFNLIFQFFLVFGMSKSLRSEFMRRRTGPADPAPGQSIGLAWCICGCCTFIPILGVVGYIAAQVIWIVYWVKMAEYSRALDQPQIIPSAV